MSSAREGLLIGLVAALALMGSGSPPASAASEAPASTRVGSDTATCLTPMSLLSAEPEPLPLVAVGAVEPWPPAGRGRPADLQPEPRQHRESCEQERYEGEFGVPLWLGPPWGVPSLGGRV